MPSRSKVPASSSFRGGGGVVVGGGGGCGCVRVRVRVRAPVPVRLSKIGLAGDFGQGLRVPILLFRCERPVVCSPKRLH